MAFADRMTALEARLLQRFGANGTLGGASEFVYDPQTDTMVPGSTNVRTARMTVGPSETLDEEGREVFRMVAKMQVKPERGETLTFAGEQFTVGNVITYYEGDTPVLYVAEVS